MTDDLSGWDFETDVLVLGSGAGGLSTAVFARKRGFQTLVCEKLSVIGGSTATSGGIIWVPCSAQAQAAGISDSIDQAKIYLKHELGGFFRNDLVDAFLEAGPEALARLEEGTRVKFDYVPWPDYHPNQVGGAAAGRTLETRRYDGRKLGDKFELICPPMQRLMLMGGLFLDKRKVDDFLNPFRSLKGFVGVANTLARYLTDRMRFSRGTDIGAGNALVARLLHTLLDMKADLWIDSPLVELIRTSERVVGAVIRRGGRPYRVRAHLAVVLATGGFPHNEKMRDELGPQHPHRHTVGHIASVGDGINAGRSIGGALDTNVASPALWQPSSELVHQDGTRETILYGYLDRGRPGVIAVDGSGKRFVNESNSYHDVGAAMIIHGAGRGNKFWFVCDRRFVWKRGLGLIRPFRFSLSRYIRNGYIVRAQTIEELATKIGVPPKVLAETVQTHNAYARTGVDLDFGKGSTSYNRTFGDPGVSPNPNLAPIEHAPFIALQIYPSSLGTCLGLKTDAHAQVVDAHDQPIRGLYACGNDVSSVMRGHYPAGGTTLGPAIVFAYIAVRHIAGGIEEQ